MKQIVLSILLLSNIIPANKTPKKELPTLPINIFAGCQFQYIKANKAPHNGKNETEKFNDINTKITNIQLAIKPSKPSIKLIKLIIDDINKIIKTNNNEK